MAITKSIFEKRYISKAQAEAAIAKADLIAVEAVKDKRTWIVVPVSIEDVPGAKELQQGIGEAFEEARKAGPVDNSARIEVIRGQIEAAKNEADIKLCYDALNDAMMGEPITTELDEEIGLKAQQIEADAQLNRAQIAGVSETKGGKLWIKASTVLKPTKLVWAIADEMCAESERHDLPMPTRKEVQDECVRRGVASGTARTQYQHWFKQRNESASEVRATIVDGKIVPAVK